MKLATNDQLMIPGLEEYEIAINELRSKGSVLFVEIGRHLSEARLQFANHPQQYWEDWLRVKFQMKGKAAEFAIAAWEMMNGTGQVLNESTLKTLVRLSPEIREDIRGRLLAGETVDRLTISKSVQKAKEIIVGSYVSSSGNPGIVTSIDGDVFMVSIGSGMPTPFFKTELILDTEAQGSLRFPRTSRDGIHSSDYQIRMMADELALTKETLYRVWMQHDLMGRWVETQHPSVSDWGNNA